MQNLDLIENAVNHNVGMDVIIVSTSNSQQEGYWQKRLEERRGGLLKTSALIIVITEDWKGGAGNGLGTLYAYVKARKKCLEMHNIDIPELQERGSSVAIYHTAGQGTRLSPLSASEYNNKSAVKLPGLVGNKDCITLLEAVLKQTSIYAPSRKGRLSVFWGDQIFIPSKSCMYKTTHAIDILVRLNQMPSEQVWKEKGLDKYGLVVIDKNQDAQHIDKAEYKTIKQLMDQGSISSEGGIGTSLGSFSLSLAMTTALLDEFSTELMLKSSKMDVEPHIWMPTTLDKETYVSVMGKKGVLENDSLLHHERMQKFKEKFLTKFPDEHFFGAVDVGQDCLWWDYGTIGSYYETNMKMVDSSEEADAMRRFYRVGPENMRNGSCLINCEIDSGKIEKSVLVGVKAKELNINGCLIINSTFDQLKAEEALFYNVVEKKPLRCGAGTIRADLDLGDEHIKMQTLNGRDGKDDWDVRLKDNEYSYAELSEKLKGT